MADVIFLKLKNGGILKHEGDYAIHQFVMRKIQKHEGSETVRYVCNRVGLLEPNPRVWDKIMARFFSVPGCVTVLGRVPDEKFPTLIRELKDHLSYSLFPMAPEFDHRDTLEFGGGALMRSLSHLPRGPSTYFVNDWRCM